MSEPDDPTPQPQIRTLSGEEAQAALREALQSVASAFAPAGRQPNGILGSLQALGRLSDPHVRDQINHAFAQLHGLQGSTVHGQATVIDLRGTAEGQALRGLVQRLGAASLASRPGFAFHDETGDEPQVLASQPQIAEAPSSLVVSIGGTGPTRASEDVIEAIAQTQARPNLSPTPRQPSLVEDAGGGLFGWLSRLFGGRG